MLTVEQIKRKLQDRNLVKVAAGAGISYPALWNLVNKKQENLHYKTVKKISDYLEEK